MHFWKPRNYAFWPSPESQEPFSLLPRHVLSSFMVWNAGVGPWWAATAEIFKITSGSGQPLRAQTDSTNNARWTTQQNSANQTYEWMLCRQIFEWLNIAYILTGAQQNNRDPKRFSGWCLIINCTFPCQKGVQNRTLTPDPRTFTKMSAILLQTPLVSCWHQRGAFGNPFSGRDFRPAHLGTSRHKLSMQGCSVRSSLRSCILKIGWELWGKNFHRNGSPDCEWQIWSWPIVPYML